LSRKRLLKDNFGTRLYGKCQWNLLITLNRKERQVITIEEVQVDRQVPKGGAAKRDTYNFSQLITQIKTEPQRMHRAYQRRQHSENRAPFPDLVT
jgi:hypothetical protein